MNNKMSKWADGITKQKYSHELADGTLEAWPQIAHRNATTVMKAVGASSSLIKEMDELITERIFIPGGRYLYACGRPYHQTQNCVLVRNEDSREGWADHMHKCAMALMTGAGVGNVYSDTREEGALIKKTGGLATGPLALMQMTNEEGRGIMQGGSRRSALWAGLHWWHPDIFKFIVMKNWSPEVRAMKAKDFNFPATMDGTNISVILDSEFFIAYGDKTHKKHKWAYDVYWKTVRQMLETAEPGFSIDCGVNEGENNRNACTEVTSKDDSDICNLGSINMSRITSLEQMKRAVDLGTAFLTAGTVYSDLPYEKISTVREKNRRLGLGLMGLHDWLMTNGKTYGPDKELGKYMEIYQESGSYAKQWSDKWNLSTSIKTRAIAPTGSIGIVGETTTGIEPIFCVAYKRRYLKNKQWHHQYIVDPTADRLIKGGMDPEKIEDAVTISNQVERRVAFQAWVQKYVDHAISSTINLPAWGTENNNESKVKEFGNMLLKYLPDLRGVTCYPDGARDGQPLSRVKYSTALTHTGQVFVEGTDICDVTKKGSCG
jgi:ribonucleoside-diphosphate reductase alpha chain